MYDKRKRKKLHSYSRYLMLVCISFAGGYENREKKKKEEKNCMYGANCKYYEQFFIINNNHRTWKGKRINRGRIKNNYGSTVVF